MRLVIERTPRSIRWICNELNVRASVEVPWREMREGKPTWTAEVRAAGVGAMEPAHALERARAMTFLAYRAREVAETLTRNGTREFQLTDDDMDPIIEEVEL